MCFPEARAKWSPGCTNVTYHNYPRVFFFSDSLLCSIFLTRLQYLVLKQTSIVVVEITLLLRIYISRQDSDSYLTKLTLSLLLLICVDVLEC